MTRDEVIALAREAGLEILSLDGEDEVGCGDGYHIQTDLIERFAALVAAHERERILEMCKEGWWDGEGIRYHLEKQDAIRSRA